MLSSIQLRRRRARWRGNPHPKVRITSDYVTKPIPSDKPEIGFVERPRGSYKQFANNCDSTVSLMTVLPCQRLSLQFHTDRSELWIAIAVGAIVQVSDIETIPKAGDEVWIPANAEPSITASKQPNRIHPNR